MPIPQTDWRYCNKCYGLFYDGYPDKGQCPGGGGHEAIGYHFWLLHDEPVTQSSHKDFRYCGKCHGMFYDGFPEKGRCPGGGGHEAIGYNFVLYADVSLYPQPFQADWRYCDKCHGIFYDGYNLKGQCPGGGGHKAEPTAYNYVLLHSIAVEVDNPE